MPELFFGRLAEEWQEFKQRRMPSADIPAAIRRIDPTLRHQPSIELASTDNAQIVRIGPQTLAYLRRAPYPGWEEGFGSSIAKAIRKLFAVVPKVSVTRLGLRYVNAFRSDVHGVSGIDKLNLAVKASGKDLTSNLNLIYRVPVWEGNSCTVRIFTSDMVQGAAPKNTTVVADLDVYTDDGFSTGSPDDAVAWSERAHVAEKEVFFGLMTDEMIERLREV